MPAISLIGVSKLFGRFAALRDVSADFEAARLCAIFGENGAGKSTLLRIVAGLARPTHGTVSFEANGGKPIGLFAADHEENRPAVLQSIGYMAHASMLYDEMSAMENLRYCATLFGISDEAHIAAAIERVGLDPRLERRVGDYSQGMRQRLSLARALLHEPGILLLDEPFSNLDTTGAREIAALLGKLRDGGKAILVVTHQAAHLEAIADESLLLSQGHVAGRATGVGVNAASALAEAVR
ncbi:MAG TPA: ABC transporter ATP-binding protein [Terriglobales bacterium]|nr:ABC transporter ATP-binding protein [Terriglobales bacterium]